MSKKVYILYFFVSLLVVQSVITNACGAKQSVDVDDKFTGSTLSDRTTQTGIIFTNEEIILLDAINEGSIFELLNKEFDKEYAEQRYHEDKEDPYRYANMDADKDIEVKQIVLLSMLNHLYYSRLLYSDSFMLNYASLIEDGLLAYIPQNHYSGQDVNTSLEYSPGDLVVASDNKATCFIYHYGDKEGAFDSSLDDYNRLFYGRDHIPDNSGNYFDGRTQYHLWKIPESELSGALSGIETGRRQIFGADHSPEYVKVSLMNMQVGEMITRYHEKHEAVPDTLDQYIDYYGRMNPNAWVNPYDGSKMQKLDFADCQYSFSMDMNLMKPPVPQEMIKHVSDRGEYPGNYSVGVYEDDKSKVFIFAIYYLDKNNQLAALVSRGIPRSRFLSEAWEM